MTQQHDEPLPIVRPWFDEREMSAVQGVLASGWVAQGPQVEAFEREFAVAAGASHAVAVSSCTTALHLALVVAGIGATDEVVVPSLSFIATTNVVTYVGATPVFADVDPVTQNVTAQTVTDAISSRTRAVVAVHQAGMPVDLDPLRELCTTRGLTLIEDAACAAGSSYKGRPIGSGASVAAFSFHPRKILVTGEGGMLVTDKADWAARARRLREHAMSLSQLQRHRSGSPVFESYDEVGFNYRMTDLQAAVGRVQLAKLHDMVEDRRRLARRYSKGLAELRGVTLPSDPPFGRTNYQSYVVVLPEDLGSRRNDLMAALGAEGIATRRGIMAAHLERPFLAKAKRPLPVTESLASRSVILPLFHGMKEGDVDRVVARVLEFCSREES